MQKTAARVAERYLQRAAVRSVLAAKKMTEEQIKKALLAFRKGSSTGMTIGKYVGMLEYLGGWKIKPVVGLVKLTIGEHDWKAFEPEEEEAAIAYEAQIKTLEVATLPANPKLDQVYLLNVRREVSPHNGAIFVRYETWIGAMGINFISPEGKEFDLLPDRYSFHSQRKSPLEIEGLGKRTTKYLRDYELTKWLKETSAMEQVLKALDMPSVGEERAQKVRTRDNTGTCSVCFRNIKLKGRGPDNYRMADHGYKRPGWGTQTANCFGAAYNPYEVSSEGTKAYLKALENELKRSQDRLRDLKADKVDEIYADTGRRVERVQRGDRNWEKVRSLHMRQVQKNIDEIRYMTPQYKKLIADWKPQELPREGDQFRLLLKEKN